jgi:N-acyl-D-glutamate deacylase
VGADADIIVFDPAKAKMTAAAESPASFSRGMNYVIVEGQLLIEEGRMNLTLLPGQPIRRAVKPRGTIARITGLVDQREQGA